MNEFFKQYGGRLLTVSPCLPHMSIDAPNVVYDIREATIIHDCKTTHLSLSINEDGDSVSMFMDCNFAVIFDNEITRNRGYIVAYIYSKHKANECFELARITIDI